MRSCYVTSVLRDNDGNCFIEMHTELEKALGFETGSEVYFSWLENEIEIENRKEWRHELIVTSISPDAWNDLYDIEFHLGDSPGSIASVAEILAREQIRILIAHSRTTMRGVRAEWAVSADFSRFNGDSEEFKEFLRKEIEENPDENKRKELEKQILKVTSENEREDYVRIKRSRFYEKLKELKKWGKDIPFCERSTFIQTRVIGDREVDTLGISQYIIQRLSRELSTDPQNIDAVVIIADKEGLMLSLWFLHPTEKIAKISFEIDYEPGSLFEIAEFLSSKGVSLLETDFNILAAGDRGAWKIVADINGNSEFPCVYSDCRSIGELERRLAADMRKAGIRAFRKIVNSEEVGIWARKPIQNLPKEREIAIERGQREKAEEFLLHYFNSFSSNVTAILPYMDKTTFDYLNQIPKCCGIRVITSFVKDRTECLKKADRLAGDRPFVEILEIALKTEEDNCVPLEHTRWISDDNFFIILETDLKRSSLGSRDYSVEVKKSGECGGRRKSFEKRWNQSRSELEEEFKTTVARKFFYSSSAFS